MSQQQQQIMIKQLGGMGRLRAMIGAHNFLTGGSDTLSFKFKGSRKANYVQIILDASDTYSVKVSKVNKWGEGKTVADVSGVYADALKGVIERASGLLLSL